MPTLKSLQAEGRRVLAAAGVESAALDARLLLQAATGFDAARLIAEGAAIASPDAVAAFHDHVSRRAMREPVSKILGVREFYGRSFQVTADVLDPRPDSESLIELCLTLQPAGAPLRILDLGTGSGILVLTLLAERPQATGVAVDLSAAALAVAGRNATALGLAGRVQFVSGHWFEGVDGTFDLIVSNPPYIPAHDIVGLAPEVRLHDPLLALDGGPDGLAPYRAIAAEVSAHLAPGGHVVVEIGAGQQTDVTGIFQASGLALAATRRDLGDHVRALAFRRP